MIWQIALDIIQDVRGSIAMYMFIIEESVQTVGMACYLSWKQGEKEKARDLASWAIANVIEPALDFVHTYGSPAYPLNISYDVFFTSSLKTFQNYLELP